MTNAEKFYKSFGVYATELWAMPEEKFLEWLNYEQKKANADQIRSMTDEELSSFLDIATVCVCFPCTRDINNLKHFYNCKHENGTCEKEWLEWLKGDTDEDKA